VHGEELTLAIDREGPQRCGDAMGVLRKKRGLSEEPPPFLGKIG